MRRVAQNLRALLRRPLQSSPSNRRYRPRLEGLEDRLVFDIALSTQVVCNLTTATVDTTNSATKIIDVLANVTVNGKALIRFANDGLTEGEIYLKNSNPILNQNVDSLFGNTANLVSYLHEPAHGTALWGHPIVNQSLKHFITYTPAPGFTGTDTFTYMILVTDGVTGSDSGFAVGTVDVTVTAPATPPQIVSAATTTFTVGEAGKFPIVLQGKLPISVTIAHQPSWASLQLIDGKINLTGTPPIGSEPSYSFTLTPSNSAGTGTVQNFTLKVIPGNTRTWTGTVNSSWNNPKNWKEKAVPAAGNDLIFPAGARTASTNDMAGLSLHKIQIDAAGYTITGAPITITSSITDRAAGKSTYALATKLSPLMDITVNQGGVLIVSGVLSGANGFVKAGTGELDVTAANTFTGDLTLELGVLGMSAGSGLGKGDFKVSAASDSTTVTLKPTGKTLNVTNPVTVARGNMSVAPGNVTFAADLNILSAGKVTAAANVLITVASTVSGAGEIDILGGTLIDHATGPNLSTAHVAIKEGSLKINHGAFFSTGLLDLGSPGKIVTLINEKGAYANLPHPSIDGGVLNVTGRISMGNGANAPPNNVSSWPVAIISNTKLSPGAGAEALLQYLQGTELLTAGGAGLIRLAGILAARVNIDAGNVKLDPGLAGAGPIGVGALGDGGTLLLQGTSTFAGTITLASGAIKVAGTTSLDHADLVVQPLPATKPVSMDLAKQDLYLHALTLKGGTLNLNPGTLTFQSDVTVSKDSTINPTSQTSQLSQVVFRESLSGPGILTISGAGSVVADDGLYGKVNLTGASDLTCGSNVSGDGTITLNGGVLKNIDTSHFEGNVVVNRGTIQMLGADIAYYAAGGFHIDVKGAGTLTWAGAGISTGTLTAQVTLDGGMLSVMRPAGASKTFQLSILGMSVTEKGGQLISGPQVACTVGIPSVINISGTAGLAVSGKLIVTGNITFVGLYSYENGEIDPTKGSTVTVTGQKVFGFEGYGDILPTTFIPGPNGGKLITYHVTIGGAGEVDLGPGYLKGKVTILSGATVKLLNTLGNTDDLDTLITKKPGGKLLREPPPA